MIKLKIGASSPHKNLPFSEAIKYYTGKPYSHVYVRFYDPYNQKNMIAESSRGEHHLVTFDIWRIINKVVKEYELELSEDEFFLWYSHNQNMLQTPYGILAACLGVPLYDLFERYNSRFFHDLAEYFIDGKNNLICSEAVSYLLKIKGVRFNRPYDFIRTDHIVEKLDKLCKTEEYIKAVKQ